MMDDVGYRSCFLIRIKQLKSHGIKQISKSLERAAQESLLGVYQKIQCGYNRNIKLTRILKNFLFPRNVHTYPRFIRIFLTLENSHKKPKSA